MSEVTRILSAIEQGEPEAASQLLPFVYDELRRLAASQLAQEKPGQTLQPTALVHEAYLRLVNTEEAQQWDSRRHFFAAAAEAMRRILIENARRKQRQRHGGEQVRIELDQARVGRLLLVLLGRAGRGDGTACRTSVRVGAAGPRTKGESACRGHATRNESVGGSNASLSYSLSCSCPLGSSFGL